jgi:hypothetical protein
VKHFGHGHGIAYRAEQVEFLPAERGVMLVDSEHDRVSRRVEMQLEIGIARPLPERLCGEDPVGKQGADYSFQQSSGWVAASRGSDPSGCLGRRGSFNRIH